MPESKLQILVPRKNVRRYYSIILSHVSYINMKNNFSDYPQKYKYPIIEDDNDGHRDDKERTEILFWVMLICYHW